MVEQIIAGENPDAMYWIHDDEEGGLCWSPGRVVEVKPRSYEVECIVSGDRYEIDKDDPAVVHPSCLGKELIHRANDEQCLTCLYRWCE